MTVYTRQIPNDKPQELVDLTMGEHLCWTTTRDYFSKPDFLQLREDLKTLKGTEAGRTALGHLVEGKPLPEAEKELLKKTLGKFADHRGAVDTVDDWVKRNGQKLPEDILRSAGGRPLFQTELRHGADELHLMEVKTPGTIDALRQLDAGKLKPNQLPREMYADLKRADMLDGLDQVTGLGNYLMKPDGKGFMAAVGNDMARIKPFIPEVPIPRAAAAPVARVAARPS